MYLATYGTTPDVVRNASNNVNAAWSVKLFSEASLHITKRHNTPGE